MAIKFFVFMLLWIAGCAIFVDFLQLERSWLMLGGVVTCKIFDVVWAIFEK